MDVLVYIIVVDDSFIPAKIRQRIGSKKVFLQTKDNYTTHKQIVELE